MHTNNRLDKLTGALALLGVPCVGVGVTEGANVTRFELQPSTGFQLEKLLRVERSIAFSLGVASVRIVAPIPDTSLVGIEVPQKERIKVPLADVMAGESYRGGGGALPFCLGARIGGALQVADVAEFPHLLIAGATGTGKSVCLNSLILSLVCGRTPAQLRLVLIDPKKVEFAAYSTIPHLLVPVIKDVHKVPALLNWLVLEMQRRYDAFVISKSRSIISHNEKVGGGDKLPYIVVIIDELADLMLAHKKEIEESISRLASLARAAGIHLVFATQRPSVGVVTGVIKANFPARIAFRCASQVDARTILDRKGAETLAGKGDFLFQDGRGGDILRLQGAFVSDAEVESMVASVSTAQPVFSKGAEKAIACDLRQSDSKGDTTPVWYDLSEVRYVMREYGYASTELLRKACKYPLEVAQACIDEMTKRGIIAEGAPLESRAVLLNLNF
jgi:S-DNA-T family DNA segregation ATPase FtsK/SpoIIIE